jgi:NAD(P)-dependent dehydrogenase (short-subunit alcohol dehydrogenase family)
MTDPMFDLKREPPYADAKSRLNTLTDGFARAFGPAVTCERQPGGPLSTDIWKAWDLGAFAERARSSIALGRGGEPDEMVGAVLYFACAASSYCTGAVLRLDGGMHARVF